MIANLDGADGTVVTIAGGGTVDANQGGGNGFADAGGFAGFNGKWIVEAGATLRGLRNGATAWGAQIQVRMRSRSRAGDSLMPGDTFNLFDAPSFAGGFASVSLPTVGNPGYFWDTSDLAVDGTITVVPEPGPVGLLATGFGLLLSRRRRRS